MIFWRLAGGAVDELLALRVLLLEFVAILIIMRVFEEDHWRTLSLAPELNFEVDDEW